MVYQFTGTAKVFNGRFWREYPVRAKASTFPLAISRATKAAIKAHRTVSQKRSVKIEAIAVTLERLGQVVPVAEAARQEAELDTPEKTL